MRVFVFTKFFLRKAAVLFYGRNSSLRRARNTLYKNGSWVLRLLQRAAITFRTAHSLDFVISLLSCMYALHTITAQTYAMQKQTPQDHSAGTVSAIKLQIIYHYPHLDEWQVVWGTTGRTESAGARCLSELPIKYRQAEVRSRNKKELGTYWLQSLQNHHHFAVLHLLARNIIFHGCAEGGMSCLVCNSWFKTARDSSSCKTWDATKVSSWIVLIWLYWCSSHWCKMLFAGDFRK